MFLAIDEGNLFPKQSSVSPVGSLSVFAARISVIRSCSTFFLTEFIKVDGLNFSPGQSIGDTSGLEKGFIPPFPKFFSNVFSFPY